MEFTEDLGSALSNSFRQLNLPKGEYFVLPNQSEPAFLLPAHDALVFKKSLNYLVPRSAAARWKKRALSYAPWTTLQRHLPKCYVEGANTTHPHLPRLIMPWNQGPAEKLTWIEEEEKQTVVR
ncbi:MAG: hypothetical protein ACFB10_24130 [Salibacteraceae bacterium]